MAGTQSIAEDRRDRVIEDSIRDQRPSVLTLQTQRGWRTYRSRFISGSKPTGTVVIQVDSQEDARPVELPPPGESLGVTFRSGHMKCMFSSVLQSVRAEGDGPMVILRWPEEIQRLQRRMYERAAPPSGTVIAVRFWRHDPSASSPGNEPSVRYGQLEDVSAGGLRLQTAETEGLEPDLGYRCAFSPKPHSPSLVIDATLRHLKPTDQGRVSLGFQFVGLETTLEGRRNLNRVARIVSQFHRSSETMRR